MVKLKGSGPLSRVVVQPTAVPARSLMRLGHVTAVANQMNESRVREHPRQLRHDLDVNGSLISPARLALGFQMQSVDGLDYVAQIRRRHLTQVAPDFLRLKFHVRPSVVLSHYRDGRLDLGCIEGTI